MTSFDPQTNRLSKLSDAKLALLNKRIQRGETDSKRHGIAKRTTVGPVPLSAAQTRMWFLSQYSSQSAEYNMCAAVKMQGYLNISALEESLSAIANRHETLRTSFIELNGEPQQLIASEIRISLERVDLRMEKEGIRESEALRGAEEDARRPFDLTEAPLLRTKLFVMNENTHIFYINMHHIISDGWSKGLFINEIMTFYKSLVDHESVTLPELPVQYADYALWEREQLQSEICRLQLNYWKQNLQGPHPVLQLPMERAASQGSFYTGGMYSFSIPEPITTKLREFGKAEGATLFMMLLSAFKTLLFRYTGQEDLMIGTPVANRNHPETAHLIGCFVNTLVIRTQVASGITFRDLIGRVKSASLNAYSNQDVSFEKVLEELHIGRTVGISPLFQAMFAMQNTPKQAMELPGLTLDYMSIHNETAKYNLVLSVSEERDVLESTLEYNSGLFDRNTVERMADHFLNLLGSAVSSPDVPVSRLSIMNAAEKEKMIMEYSGSVSEKKPQSTHLAEWFEQQVAQTPERVALTYEGEEVTYRDLNERSNQVAHYLQGLGIEPEQFIGLFMERSIEMVVGIIGILKAGGAYVPLDPMLPADRLSYMLSDTGLRMIVTMSGSSSSLPVFKGELIELDLLDSVLAGESVANPGCKIKPEHLAYMIYTSGSTGQPKGVMVEHGNVVRLLQTTKPQFEFKETDVWTLFHSYAFDFSVWEIWGALLFGGRLVVVPYWVSRSPEDFYNLLHVEKVTVLNQTPSAFRQLMKVEESDLNAGSLALRYIVFGGEALDLLSLKPWFQRHGDQYPQLINMYGITETTVHTTLRPIALADLESSKGSVIGRPLGDLEIYVMDEYMQPVPVGVPGEMYVGGAGVTRGYWGRAELTASRFITHPYNKGERLYKTGDLACFLPDGDLEYIGRIDHQVKMNGFRIELGEIEAVLKQNPSIREAVVTIREEPSGLKRLEAYLVKITKETINLQELRSYLRQKLPGYMIPAVFHIIESIPLTHNGKVDLKALISMKSNRIENQLEHSAPRTEQEQRLCQIWQDVLAAEMVGIDDNYFELGGDSIRAIRVRAESQRQGIVFTIQQLFEFQTIRLLVQAIQYQGQDSPAVLKRMPFDGLSFEDRARIPESIEDAYPLTRLQSGMLFHSELQPEGSSIYHNISSANVKGRFEFSALDQAAQQLVARHPVLRTSFDLSSYSVPLQLVHQAAKNQIEVEDLRNLPKKDRDAALLLWCEKERKNLFDWKTAPLFRINIHLLTEDTFQFTLTEHHSILDGWSVASMLTELFAYYNEYLMNREPQLKPKLDVAFSDYVAMEQQALESSDGRRFWNEHVKESPVYRMPVKTEVDTGNLDEPVMDTAEFNLTEELHAGAKKLAALASVPLKTVLLASHLYVIHTLSNEEDIMTGMVTNCRPEELAGDEVLGLFLNTLPLRVKMKGKGWIDLVKQTFETEMEVWPHRRLPLDEIQKNAGQGQPLFDTVFNFTDFHIYQSFEGIGELSILSTSDTAYTNFNVMTQFNLDPKTSELRLILQWNKSRFSQKEIIAFKDYYTRTLEAMTQEPLAAYSDFTPLSDEERYQTVTEWNKTGRDYQLDKPLIQWIEEQAERTPDAMAIRFEDLELTYRELDQEAERLARRLRRLGAGPDGLVGISAERSLEMMVGLLGILKSGAAYVPLDPAYPRERLAFMLEDAGVPILLTQSHLAPELPEHSAHVVLLDGPGEMLEDGEEEAAKRAAAGRKDAIYMIYTSGSTGNPKGVINIQEAVVNRLLWMQETFGLTPEDRVMQKTPISFDVSV
ncbi:amino acid adenylation domain-containing protein, partial [Paenibacillus sp. HJL G12]